MIPLELRAVLDVAGGLCHLCPRMLHASQIRMRQHICNADPPRKAGWFTARLLAGLLFRRHPYKAGQALVRPPMVDVASPPVILGSRSRTISGVAISLKL